MRIKSNNCMSRAFWQVVSGRPMGTAGCLWSRCCSGKMHKKQVSEGISEGRKLWWGGTLTCLYMLFCTFRILYYKCVLLFPKLITKLLYKDAP